MKKSLILAAFSAALVLCVAGNALATSGVEILQQVEDRYVGKTSKAETKMTISDSGGEKERTLTIYRQKLDSKNLNCFQHFHSPSDIMNITFLVNEKDGAQEKFIYLPSFKKTRKIVSKDNDVRYVSSDFTYEDLNNFHAADYKCGEAKEDTLNGEKVYVIEATKTDAESQYSKFVFSVSQEKLIPLLVTMSVKKDGGTKTIENNKIKKVKNIWTPYEVIIKDAKKGSSTKLTLDKIEYDCALDADTFTQRNMEK